MKIPSKSVRRKKNVILSFQIANIPGIATFTGTLRYLRSITHWNVRLYTAPATLTPEALAAAERDGVDGIIIDHPMNHELNEPLLGSEIPLIAIGNTDERLFKRRRNITFMEMDNREIGRMAARRFLSLGRFRTFAFLPDTTPARWSRLRLRGFREELIRNGLFPSVFSAVGSNGEGASTSALSDWLASLPKPIALLLCGDYLATNTFGACAAARLSIPEDIAILGVDNNPAICDSLDIPLSSIEPDFEREGFEAGKTLDQMMRKRIPSTRPQIIRFPPIRVVERESTAPCNPGSRLVERALEFISAHADSRISAKDVAAHLHISPSLLALRFRQYEKTSVRSALIERRLKLACRMLKTSRQSIEKVADRCGFSSANRFSHIFTARMGVSPRAYRDSAAKG